LALAKTNEYYTYKDYLAWPDDVRYELVGGVPYMMSPAPTRAHQRISGELFRQLGNYLKGKPCEVYAAPFDVRMSAAEDEDTVVQPDIVVVCDESKLDERGAAGAPDMVVEIISPSSTQRDRGTKYELYERVGVREYWIVDADARLVEVHALADGAYKKTAFPDPAMVPVGIFGGDLEIDFSEIIPENGRNDD